MSFESKNFLITLLHSPLFFHNFVKIINQPWSYTIIIHLEPHTTQYALSRYLSRRK